MFCAFRLEVVDGLTLCGPLPLLLSARADADVVCDREVAFGAASDRWLTVRISADIDVGYRPIRLVMNVVTMPIGMPSSAPAMR